MLNYHSTTIIKAIHFKLSTKTFFQDPYKLNSPSATLYLIVQNKNKVQTISKNKFILNLVYRNDHEPQLENRPDHESSEVKDPRIVNDLIVKYKLCPARWRGVGRTASQKRAANRSSTLFPPRSNLNFNKRANIMSAPRITYSWVADCEWQWFFIARL